MYVSIAEEMLEIIFWVYYFIRMTMTKRLKIVILLFVRGIFVMFSNYVLKSVK